MKINTDSSRRYLTAAVLSAFVAAPALALAAEKGPSSVSESAPASTGAAKTPTEAQHSGVPAYPVKNPSAVSESAPATTGPAGTPTQGQGASSPPAKAKSMDRLAKTPSSPSESGPGGAGVSKVPTAPDFNALDYNKDGVVDRSEYDRYMRTKKRN